MLDLEQALKILQSGEWCSIRCITADNNRNTGGKILEIPSCRIQFKTAIPSSAKATAKRQNHYANLTRNVILSNGENRKIHINLITHINNEPIL